MPGVQPKRDPGLDFFKPIKQRWVEHPDLLAYITCQEPFQGLKTTPAIAGLRVKLELKSKDTYRLLVRVLREESGLDLEREIAKEKQRANARLAMVHENGEIGNGRSSLDIIKPTSGGTFRSYLVGRLKREAAKAEGKDPLFVEPEVVRAVELLPRVEAGELSVRAAALLMGWKKVPMPYDDMVSGWRRAGDHDRMRFEDFIDQWHREQVEVA
jgi:hypothetical protein